MDVACRINSFCLEFWSKRFELLACSCPFPSKICFSTLPHYFSKECMRHNTIDWSLIRYKNAQRDFSHTPPHYLCVHFLWPFLIVFVRPWVTPSSCMNFIKHEWLFVYMKEVTFGIHIPKVWVTLWVSIFKIITVYYKIL